MRRARTTETTTWTLRMTGPLDYFIGISFCARPEVACREPRSNPSPH
ncbi:MAG: hypothetical protein MZV63_65335 [Marinilabiliales bacterium]|nr:hypothetical protein [Marinilabiliales bacterium]